MRAVRAAGRGQGALKTKNDLEAPLIKQLVKFANALYLLHKKENNLEVALGLHLRKSEYDEMGQTELASEAGEVAALAQARANDLGAYALQPAAAAALAAQAQAYAASVPGYKTAVERGKVGTQTLRTAFKDVSDFVNTDLRSAIELLVDEKPALYALLREALKIDETGARPGKSNGKNPKPGTPPPPADGDFPQTGDAAAQE